MQTDSTECKTTEMKQTELGRKIVKKLIDCLEKVQDFSDRETMEGINIDWYDTCFVDFDRVLGVIFDIGYLGIELTADENIVISSLLENRKCIVPLMNYIASGYPAIRRGFLKRRSSAEFLLKILENSKIEEKELTVLIDDMKKSITEFHKELKDLIDYFESDSDIDESDDEAVCHLNDKLNHTWWKDC